jgi:hypothetical protein
MKPNLSSFAARLGPFFGRDESLSTPQFAALALELFALQFQHNPAYQKICSARQRTPATVTHWTQIPCVPTSAFKELELTCLSPVERTAVFHSSGTTEQKPSRHFHNPESLAIYEASLWAAFQRHLRTANPFVSLTPEPAVAPRSSLVQMFETVRQRVGSGAFFGRVAADGAWTMDFATVIEALKKSAADARPLTLLGTAFSFVHLLDFLAEKRLRVELPAGSQVLETGGYKNRSRVLPKPELHALITRSLGVGRENIICEYGMSELSSQAYDSAPTLRRQAGQGSDAPERYFHFPPWARVQIISPETGREVAEGETGLIRIFDLANVFSVAAIQTEDLGIRRGDGFELMGRAQLAEPRGCSLLTA